MAFKIPGFDIDRNPATNSFLGMSRNNAKKIAKVFIIFGIFFSLPPFFPDPTDLLSIWLANIISKQFGISLINALASTYLIGIVIFLVGIWIYPYNTHSLLNGYISKLKLLLKKIMKQPVYIAIGIAVFILLFKWYAGQM